MRIAHQFSILALGMIVTDVGGAQEPPRAASARPTTAQTAPEPKRIATKLAAFGIPIVASALREGVKEVQLHVSADRGKTWHLYYRVKAGDKYFPFKAAADGEYWFATRTVDAKNNSTPEGDLHPEMKVVVDTTPPRLTLTSQMLESGEIRASWQANDPQLAPQSLKIEYQTDPNGPWRAIAAPASKTLGDNGAVGGSVAWTPREAGRIVNLRAAIVDQAGNEAVALDRLEQGAVAKTIRPLEPPVAGPAKPDSDEGALSAMSKIFSGALGGGKSEPLAGDPYASEAPSDEGSRSAPAANTAAPKSSGSSWASSGSELTDEGVRPLRAQPNISASKPAAPKVNEERRGPGKFASATMVREPHRAAEGGIAVDDRPSILPPANGNREEDLSQTEELHAPADSGATSEPEEIPPPKSKQANSREGLVDAQRSERAAMEELPAEALNESPHQPIESLPHRQSRPPVRSMPREKPTDYRAGRGPIASGLTGADLGPARPPVNSAIRNASASRETELEATATRDRLPAGVEPSYTNQMRFDLEYDVNTVGPGGISDVELWATRDGGQSWSRWGADPDRRSPFDVEVDGEGVFGFRIVVLSRGGLASRPPQSGDDADQWVVVDATEPKVTLRGAGYGADERVGQLEISWDAVDANLTEKSVALFYSDREEGPWTKIVGDLSNQGVYYWRVDSRIPPKIFIKVEVRDGAGNVGSDRTREAIRVEGLVPSGKIRRIVPHQDENE